MDIFDIPTRANLCHVRYAGTPTSDTNRAVGFHLEKVRPQIHEQQRDRRERRSMVGSHTSMHRLHADPSLLARVSVSPPAVCAAPVRAGS